LRKRISGLTMPLTLAIEGPTRRAVVSGRAMAKFLGYNSPNTIWNVVASSKAMATDTPVVASPNRGEITSAMAGLAMNPSTRDDTVMPSCAPER